MREKANKNDIDDVGKEDEFDILIQYAKEWIGGDGMTKTKYLYQQRG